MLIELKIGPPVIGLLLLSVALVSIMATITVAFMSYPLDEDQKKRIFVHIGPLESPKSVLEACIEYFLLLKINRMGYRNSPSGNIRIIPTFWTTLFISILLGGLFYCLNKIDPTFVIGKKNHSLDETYLFLVSSFTALWLGLYWKEKKDLHEKWKYLADLYNQVISTPPGKTKHNFSSRESLRVALAIDILVMGMWGHRSFYANFESVLVEAYSHKNNMPQVDTLNFLEPVSKTT